MALLLVAGTGTAFTQIAAPRYQSPIEAPKPQLSLPAPNPVTPNGTVVEYPVARVNDQIIDNSDYQRSMQQLTEEAQQTNMSQAELQQRQKDLLRDLIDQQLLLSRGKELDISAGADAEVIRRLDELRKQFHFDTMEDLEKAVRQQGISYEDYKQNIKNQVITQQVVRDEVGRNLRMTAKDEQAYYEQHKQEFSQPETVHLSEILIPTPDNATDAQIAQAQAKADDVAAKIKAGDKFDDLAKQFSGGPNADIGGDLGEYKRGALPKVLEDATFSLKTGETAAPIRTRQGFVLLKVTAHNAAGIPPLSAVDEQVQQAMYEEAIKPALRTYLTKLREDAYVEVAAGFVDTGASPKEVRPVYTSTAPVPVKKKKTEKARLDQHAATAATTAAPATTGSKPATPAATTQQASAPPPPAATLTASNKKRKKIHREKIRYGQMPRNSLPAAPEETLASGADVGPGAQSSVLPAPGEAIAPVETANVDPLAARAAPSGKTRYSARQLTEAKTKAATKVAKAKEKKLATPAPETADEKTASQLQNTPLGLNGDTATKKKKKKVKGEAKERIQQAPPAPPAPKPEATPIPPKSVRDNGEPTVNPAPAAAPASGSSGGNTQPSAPSASPAPANPPANPQ